SDPRADAACAVRRPPADFHRRRRHRRIRLRGHAGVRRHGLLGRAACFRHFLLFPGPERRAALARAPVRRRRNPPIMIDHGLDLAVVGSGRTAALVDPTGRIVWWCFPRFDAEPVFCRLLSGEDEKGFTDIVLDGMVDYQSNYVRNTAVVSTVLTDRHGGAVRI